MAVQRKDLKTFKHNGRKYITVKAVANRQEHSTVAIKLVKRAGKAHWFVAEVTHVGIKGKEVTNLVRCKDFWDALSYYDETCECIGVVNGEHAERLDELLELTEDDRVELVRNVEARISV